MCDKWRVNKAVSAASSLLTSLPWNIRRWQKHLRTKENKNKVDQRVSPETFHPIKVVIHWKHVGAVMTSSSFIVTCLDFFFFSFRNYFLCFRTCSVLGILDYEEMSVLHVLQHIQSLSEQTHYQMCSAQSAQLTASVRLHLPSRRNIPVSRPLSSKHEASRPNREVLPLG